MSCPDKIIYNEIDATILLNATIASVSLKIAGAVTWSWPIVLIPLWVYLAQLTLLLTLAGIGWYLTRRDVKEPADA